MRFAIKIYGKNSNSVGYLVTANDEEEAIRLAQIKYLADYPTGAIHNIFTTRIDAVVDDSNPSKREP